ncbi:CAP domain-containing protein [Citreimonas sp.]|uniref:CAP domain-containing protein n=1 Tax=Citreimonas sp. TaxID=3036715 RepID=UPI004059DFAF
MDRHVEPPVTLPRLLCGLAVAALNAVATPALAQEPDDLAQLRDRALALVNASRDDAGLATLTLDPILNEAAQGHAADMIDRDFYAHVGPDGETPFDRFRDAGGSQWALSGENIARCAGCSPPPDVARVEAFHEGWMNSPEHRENILSEGFDRFGFGIEGEGDEIYAVQTFAGPGDADGGPVLDPMEAQSAALEAVNARRAEAGLEPLQASETLDTAARRLLKMRLAGEEPPQNILDLLPDDAGRWTSLAILTASRGGAGAALSAETVTGFVENWADRGAETGLGGARATHLGFAATAQDSGRTTAVALFGGRD